jgi:hypothetical protein
MAKRRLALILIVGVSLWSALPSGLPERFVRKFFFMSSVLAQEQTQEQNRARIGKPTEPSEQLPARPQFGTLELKRHELSLKSISDIEHYGFVGLLLVLPLLIVIAGFAFMRNRLGR